MEHTGFEPVTSTMRMWRAPSCANAPYQDDEVILTQFFKLCKKKRIEKQKRRLACSLLDFTGYNQSSHLKSLS